MEKKVLNYIKDNKMLQCGDSVVLGVSGGADSICMLVILNKISKQMNLTLTVVHVNHHIRKKEAEEDQEFVEDFCKKINVKCRTFHVEAEKLAKDMKCSVEEAGRIARYGFFNRTLEEERADKIAVAHNLNDNSETILFHLLRGSGIKGLCGIMPVRDRIIRPILCLSRDEIEHYLRDSGINYRTDSTNLTNDYTRNKLRNNVIPYLEENINKNAARNIAMAGINLAEIEEYLKDQTEKAFEKYVIKTEKGYFIRNDVVQEDVVIRKRIIRSMIELLSGKLKDITRKHIENVMNLLELNTGSMSDLPYGIKALREYKGVSLYMDTGENTDWRNEKEEAVIYKEGEPYENKYVKAEPVNQKYFDKNIPEIRYTKWIDCDKIKNMLVVRKRRTGDFLTIDDKGNKKKLKDYFINEKVPKEKRDEILLVADGSHIVWVIGYRMSSEYKITKNTSKILKLTYQ